MPAVIDVWNGRHQGLVAVDSQNPEDVDFPAKSGARIDQGGLEGTRRTGYSENIAPVIPAIGGVTNGSWILKAPPATTPPARPPHLDTRHAAGPHFRVFKMLLFPPIAGRSERKFVRITAHLVFSQWDQIFKDRMTTMAAVDRRVHHATLLVFTGDNLRAGARNNVKSSSEVPRWVGGLC